MQIGRDGPYNGVAPVYADAQSNDDYSASAPDLSSLVTKLKRGRPDVIFHTGYNPDMTLFLRQARELGLHFDMLIGRGAGYTVYSKLKETVGNDANYFLDVDPISIWGTNPKSLKPDLLPMIKLIGEGEARHDYQIRPCRHGRLQHLLVSHRSAAACNIRCLRDSREAEDHGSALPLSAGTISYTVHCLWPSLSSCLRA